MAEHDSSAFQDEDAEAQPAAEGAAAHATDAAMDELSETERLQAELAESKNRLLRAQADMDNFRKRMQRELESERRYAGIGLLRDLLPVLDNIERAIEAAKASGEGSSLLEGFQLVAQQLQTVLAQHNCTPIEASRQTFDPNLHEAISQLPSPDHAAGEVMEVTSTGYQLHDRVVRPAQVVVSSGPPDS